MADYEQDHITRPTYDDLTRVADMSAGIVLRQMFPQRSQAVFYIPNTFVGRIVRWILARYLNRRVYKMRAFGRKPKKRGTKRPTLRHSEARMLAIYIDTKKGWE